VYESGFDGDGGDLVVEPEGDEEEVDEAGAARGYPGNLIVKSNNESTGLEETWTKRAIPWTFWVSSSSRLWLSLWLAVEVECRGDDSEGPRGVSKIATAAPSCSPDRYRKVMERYDQLRGSEKKG
jgi:hypothetical protein